jgi:hypothetical protein
VGTVSENDVREDDGEAIRVEDESIEDRSRRFERDALPFLDCTALRCA